MAKAHSSGVDISGVIGQGSSKIKKKIRDITRLLKRDNLASNVRIENERALEALKSELATVQTNLKAKKLAQRYHKVRFFERKKAVRRYKKALKELKELEAKDGDPKAIKKEIKKQKKVVRHCEVDLAYVLNFPKTEKYIALYPANTDTSGLSEKALRGIQKTEAKRTEYRKKFGELLDSGKLEVSLEDGIKIINKETIDWRPEQAETAADQKQTTQDDEFFD
ncbi:hypothetical protein KL918_005176 [Ogataea parapolymorpha]|uniref:rRNA-processing protein EFG1 n=1 Tax=Ogataea parapolymorpha (strain ATCC 26012 / BCRC 20466 / JCM 22074 / NRRL Y-7560 / DL-1) TaxID=871575 RepID=W1QBQ5_OGAPD|nr:rRNA-processing protein EFG1 [Ogataea parapolymorpha DL-1]ESW98452.1 rRNA-processing protein EFG1 [Ogataea parapolymorpha DL-1]KAG7864855.1 hypothetical protein KL918_005176 [Ogataea parapolymorpha]KAG7873359.1 hypothetical protein KL916_002308 [Ogataea parapolymorpha]